MLAKVFFSITHGSAGIEKATPGAEGPDPLGA